MSDFAGKTIFIAGAACQLGVRLLPVFVAEQARIILMDQDADRLHEMAELAPDLIEPLPIGVLNLQQCVQLGEIWDAEPLHVFINLLPLRCQKNGDEVSSISLALIQAFTTGLNSARGVVISVIPRAQASDSIAYQMSECALRKMSDLLARSATFPKTRFHQIRPELDANEDDIVTAMRWANRRDASCFSGVDIPIGHRAH